MRWGGSRSATAGAVLLVWLTLAAAGCGSGSDSSASRDETSLSDYALVSEADINKTQPGSPERTVLRWWRYIQYRSATDALSLFAPELRVALEKRGYPSLVFRYFGGWLANVEPRITGISKRDRNATVYVQMKINQSAGKSENVNRHATEYIALPLRKMKNDTWVLRDATFMLGQVSEIAEQVRAQQAAARAQAAAAARAAGG